MAREQRTTQWSLAFLVAALLIAASSIPSYGGDMSLTVGSMEAVPDSTISLPLELSDARGLGSLQFDVNYDPTALSPTAARVEAGADHGGVMVESNVVSPGTLRVALISGEPINGGGQLLTLGFTVRADAPNTSRIALVELQAWDHGNSLHMLATGVDGTVTVTARQKISRMQLAAVAMGAFVILLTLIIVGKARRKRRCDG